VNRHGLLIIVSLLKWYQDRYNKAVDSMRLTYNSHKQRYSDLSRAASSLHISCSAFAEAPLTAAARSAYSQGDYQMKNRHHRSGRIYCLCSVKGMLIAAFALMLTAFSGIISHASAEKNEHLFFIERSKNKNIVYYDICHDGNNTLCAPNPVTAYWILHGGKKEVLSSLEKKYAFGIKPMDFQSNNYRFSIVACAKNTISVEKINGKYRASTSINNREIVLEKVYVNTKEDLFGMSTVNYIEYTGRTMQENTPVKIRVVPE